MLVQDKSPASSSKVHRDSVTMSYSFQHKGQAVVKEADITTVGSKVTMYSDKINVTNATSQTCKNCFQKK